MLSKKASKKSKKSFKNQDVYKPMSLLIKLCIQNYGRCIFKHVYVYLLVEQSLTEAQRGFMKHNSTTRYVSYDRKCFRCICTGWCGITRLQQSIRFCKSQAFNSQTSIFWYKYTFVYCFNSYLTNRIQRVYIRRPCIWLVTRPLWGTPGINSEATPFLFYFIYKRHAFILFLL